MSRVIQRSGHITYYARVKVEADDGKMRKLALAAVCIFVLILLLGMMGCDSMGTENPGVSVTLNKIGVYDNCEGGLRDLLDPNGEIYMIAIITDGKTSKNIRLPATEDKYYPIPSNGSQSVGQPIFSTSKVGDYLKIAFVAYEADGSEFESVITSAIATTAIGAVTGGAGASILGLLGPNLGNVLAGFVGQEDDLVGELEFTWTEQQGWGEGIYSDRSNSNLRVWFEVKIN